MQLVDLSFKQLSLASRVFRLVLEVNYFGLLPAPLVDAVAPVKLCQDAVQEVDSLTVAGKNDHLDVLVCIQEHEQVD